MSELKLLPGHYLRCGEIFVPSATKRYKCGRKVGHEGNHVDTKGPRFEWVGGNADAEIPDDSSKSKPTTAGG